MLTIQGGKIFTMGKSGIIDDGQIVVDGTSILKVGSRQEAPQGDVIDARGKYVCPGLIDGHTHIGLEEEIYGDVGDDVNEATSPLTPELQAMDGVNLWDLAFHDAVKGGVTRAMSMPGSANIIGGQAVFLKTLGSSCPEMVYRNPWGLKAALGENPKRVYGRRKLAPQTRMGSASLLRRALFTAGRLMEKPLSQLKPEEEFSNLPLFQVLKREIPLLVHVHRADDILTALRIKDEFHIDMIIQHGTEAVLVADELVKRDVGVFLGPLFVNRAKVEMKEVAFKNAAALAKRGVQFSLVTDHPVIPIEHLRVCAALAVREGLDDETALQAVTSVPARLLKVEQELGSIEEGKRADLVIFSGHPFDFRSRVEKVLVDGILWEDCHG